jgi:hypothetical protein
MAVIAAQAAFERINGLPVDPFVEQITRFGGLVCPLYFREKINAIGGEIEVTR